MEVEEGEDSEDRQRNDLLDDFELEKGELAVADAVGWDLEAVFEEGDEPADDDDGQQRGVAVLEVAVPGDGHEDVGADEEKDGFHGGVIPGKFGFVDWMRIF